MTAKVGCARKYLLSLIKPRQIDSSNKQDSTRCKNKKLSSQFLKGIIHYETSPKGNHDSAPTDFKYISVQR